MANTFVIKRTRVIRIVENIRTRADTESDAMFCLEEGEFEIDYSEEIDELSNGEESEGQIIVDIEEIKDDY
jgi:hypothetical protein